MDENGFEMGADLFAGSNLSHDFSGNLNYNELHQASVSIAYDAPYQLPLQQAPNGQLPAFNLTCLSPTSTMSANPHLEIVEEPTDKPFRFRYKSEMHGTHGSLMGINTTKGRRTYPTVALRNFNFPVPMKAVIYCSLYQLPKSGFKRSPHSHKLVIRKGEEEKLDPHVIEVSDYNNFTATFQGMGIIHTAKKNIEGELIRKMHHELQLEKKRTLTVNELNAIQEDAKKQSKEMNLNQVVLCFQAFLKNEADNTMQKICEPVFSRVINNMKSALTGELNIAKMSRITSSAAGGDEVFLFVEKVCKNNIKVRFYELNKDGTCTWEDFGDFKQEDVHHQYGIVLKTPPYKSTHIESPVDVMIQLFRPSDGATSSSKDFRYKPAHHAGAKRRRDSRDLIPTTVQDSHNSMTPRPPRDEGPSRNSSSANSFGGHLSNDNQSFGYDDSLSGEETTLLEIFATITTSDLNLSDDDLEGWASSPEEFYSMLDMDKQARIIDPMLQTDSVCLSSPQEEKTPAHRCPLIDKLRVLIRLFKRNFDDEKLHEMMNVLVEQQAETGENILLDLIEHGSVQEIKELTIILVKYKLKDVLHSLNDLDQNCLHALVLRGYHKLLRIFLSLGADVNQVDAFGDTPLHLAVNANDEKLVEELLEGAKDLKLNEFNDNGQSPLHIAVSRNNLAIIKLLVERGASLFKKVPQSGNNALHLAVSRPDFNMPLITFLIEHDENLLREENNAGMNALQVAVLAKQPESLIKHLSQLYAESYSFAEGDGGESSSESDDED